MPLTWTEQLEDRLKTAFGQKKGLDLAKKYAHAFPPLYTDEYTPDIAITDIRHIENLSDQNPIDLDFHLTNNKSSRPLRLRLFQWREPIALSDILPILENFDLRAFNEHPNEIQLQDKSIWISDYTIAYTKSAFDMNAVKELFREALQKIYLGFCENDGFNRLILGASLSWREIIILRAYAKYLRQVGFRFSQPYIENALSNNPGIARDLVALFNARNNPSTRGKTSAEADAIEKRILSALESVQTLDEDFICRRLLALIKATLRTNYFQTGEDGQPKTYLSYKLRSGDIPELPLPVPLYEIFVYSPRFEAIHLRNAKVARGGIRWSDRREDFRTEILGLMKAQKVKNAVIVPSGAKGGFVLKALPPQATREAVQLEVIHCYKSFISGLLDLTDNIKDKSIIKPKHVVCHDDDDPYLVVAADKGTATFSDLANDISKEYEFWLGDAFASGGSTGYDHKKIGITARGAWESIKRHFRELNVDVLNTDITVIGIGDMSGDVFGNGMLYSKHLKLIAAFDHRHIFIDPDPDPETSYRERDRLFKLPTSSWEDYNPKLISKGGGVFKRTLKSITLTPQIKQMLEVEDNALPPTDLIRAILKAPVDLLFNGGIGTYVKSRHQSNAEVGDRANDYTRINGDELRCKIVGEGGNLGFTQLGRVDFALKGGLINTDFIDNSAGVDCSDHEVNLKILLDHDVERGKLSHKKRNAILASLTSEVADLVLEDNYHQALVMSFSAHHAERNLTLHQNYIKELEAIGVLNREIENIPDEKTLIERKTSGIGLTRPELAVLLAYSKIHIKTEILKSDLTDDPYLRDIVVTAFPESLRKKFDHGMLDHRLHREIIATQLSNFLVNEMGFTYVYRLQMEVGATVDEIIKAFIVSSEIYGSVDLQKSVQALDFKISMQEQYEMLYNIRNLLNLATRWFLHTTYLKGDLKSLINQFKPRIEALESAIPKLMGGATRKYLDSLINKFKAAGLSTELAGKIGAYRAIYTALNIIHISTKNHFDLIQTAKIYFSAGERMNLVWFRDQIAADSREGHWNILARLTLRDELDICQRELTVAIMKGTKKASGAVKQIEDWLAVNDRVTQRWENVLAMMHSSTQIEYSMFFIAMRELLGLIVNSQ